MWHLTSIVSTGDSGYEVSKLIVQLKLLSGRYRTERLCQFWSDNREGVCLFNTCLGQSDTVDHIVSVCPALQHVRDRMENMWHSKTKSYPALQSLIGKMFCLPSLQRTQFILDPSSINLPQRVNTNDPVLPALFKISRNFCHFINKQRMKLLKQC